MKLERAKEKVIRFGQRYGREALDLACHAAFPLAITPDLLYCLRENFLIETSWLGVADVLMSPLCAVIGNELFEIDPTIRDLLLRRLATDRRFGNERLNDLSEFMVAYVEAQTEGTARDLGHPVALEWIALTYANRGDAERLRKKIRELIAKSNAQVREQIASFLTEQEDLLLAAGLEPLIADAYEQLKEAKLFEGFPALEEFTFEVPTIVFDGDDSSPKSKLLLIEMQPVEVATIIIEKEPLKIFEDYAEKLSAEKDIDLEMVAIPGGKFLMGAPDSDSEAVASEKPRHEVTVSDFYMGRYPVTKGQWQMVMENNPSNFKGDNLPVEKVSWKDAVQFCERLTKSTGKQYRLPTEAEWEYACRAGSTTKYYFGDDAGELDQYAWYDKNAKRKTHPVGEKQPNQFGLYDMHGNVWEWCLDHWHSNYEGAPTDASAWIEGGNSDRRIARGGSWLGIPCNCRSAYRLYRPPDFRSYSVGFRVVCVP